MAKEVCQAGRDRCVMFLRVSFCDLRLQKAKEVIASRAGCLQREQPRCLEVVEVWTLLQPGRVFSQGLVELVLLCTRPRP